jgi:hypothetical protein
MRVPDSDAWSFWMRKGGRALRPRSLRTSDIGGSEGTKASLYAACAEGAAPARGACPSDARRSAPPGGSFPARLRVCHARRWTGLRCRDPRPRRHSAPSNKTGSANLSRPCRSAIFRRA